MIEMVIVFCSKKKDITAVKKNVCKTSITQKIYTYLVSLQETTYRIEVTDLYYTVIC